MVTSTSTPGSMLIEVWQTVKEHKVLKSYQGLLPEHRIPTLVLTTSLDEQRVTYNTKGQMDTICLTVSAALCRSMTRLKIFISYLSHVLEPSPQGVFLVVILRHLVGIRMGPFTRSSESLARRMRSPHTAQNTIVCYPQTHTPLATMNVC